MRSRALSGVGFFSTPLVPAGLTWDAGVAARGSVCPGGAADHTRRRGCSTHRTPRPGCAECLPRAALLPDPPCEPAHLDGPESRIPHSQPASSAVHCAAGPRVRPARNGCSALPTETRSAHSRPAARPPRAPIPLGWRTTPCATGPARERSGTPHFALQRLAWMMSHHSHRTTSAPRFPHPSPHPHAAKSMRELPGTGISIRLPLEHGMCRFSTPPRTVRYDPPVRGSARSLLVFDLQGMQGLGSHTRDKSNPE